MRIVIPGGSGQVGTVLSRVFTFRGDDVVVLSRRAQPAPWRTVSWNGETLGDWTREIDGADVVINLAGRSVNCRYTRANLDEMMRSRVASTRVIGEAIARSRRPPMVWLQASTATIYAHRFDAPNDELTGAVGGREPDVPSYWKFSIDIAMAWEAAQAAANVPQTRRVAMRAAMVMSPDRGGIFDTLLRLARVGAGGPAAGGRQFISWVHERDFVRAVDWLITHDELEGAVNIASPNPLPQRDFMRILRNAAGIVVGLPAAEWMLKLGAVFMRTDVELILKSRRVVPTRLLQSGFRFEFPEWQEAARDLVSRSGVRS